jgi:YggT family protein
MVVADLSSAISGLIITLANIASLVLVIYVLLDLARSLTTVPPVVITFHEALAQVCEPVLEPIRKVLPPLGGIDFSPLIVILLLQFIARLVA